MTVLRHTASNDSRPFGTTAVCTCVSQIADMRIVWLFNPRFVVARLTQGRNVLDSSARRNWKAIRERIRDYPMEPYPRR